MDEAQADIEFLIGEGFIGGTFISIDEREFNRLAMSTQILQCLQDVEESFALVANSFSEIEENLLLLGLRYLYEREMSKDVQQFFDDAKQSINLRLLAFLTASRAYEDHLNRRASLLSNLTNSKIDLKEKFSQTFDESLEYRVLYALRNHAVHSQLPLGRISFGGSNQYQDDQDFRDSASRLRVTVEPNLAVSDFCESDKIKKSIKSDVAGLGFQFIDLKFFVRGFISCLFKIHAEFRSATEISLQESLENLRGANNKLRSAKGDEPKHVFAYKKKEEITIEEKYTDITHRSRVIQKRELWSGLNWAQRGYVSSEITISKGTYPDKHSSVWVHKWTTAHPPHSPP